MEIKRNLIPLHGKVTFLWNFIGISQQNSIKIRFKNSIKMSQIHVDSR